MGDREELSRAPPADECDQQVASQSAQSPRSHRGLALFKVAAFVGKLRERESIGRLAFEFLILTAARSGEVRGALWSEIDLTERTWTIPAERMKADVEHIVPLSDAALDVLKRARVHKEDGNDLVFPGTRHGKPNV